MKAAIRPPRGGPDDPLSGEGEQLRDWIRSRTLHSSHPGKHTIESFFHGEKRDVFRFSSDSGRLCDLTNKLSITVEMLGWGRALEKK